MIIAIDGPAGTGKSSVAKQVAKRLGFMFFDTGAMYRCVAWLVLSEKLEALSEQTLSLLMQRFCFELQLGANQERRYFVNKVDVTELIRTQEISALASQVSQFPSVRKALVVIQRAFGRKNSSVFEGRDMGTVVFPKAELKIFLTARPLVRAERRFCELSMKFPDLADSLSQEKILKELDVRDQSDIAREISPLKQAKDAILIDTSDLTIEQVTEKIIELFYQKTKQTMPPPMRWTYRCICFIVRLYLKIFFRLHVYGSQHFVPGSGIIAANHVSYLDPPIVSVSCPEEVHFLAKESLFKVPLFGMLIRHLNSHPISRTSSDAQTFRLILRFLEEGKKVILFPEGQRSETGELQPLERGLAFLISKSRATIFPVYIAGAFEAWKIDKKLPRLFGKISCIFGSPLYFDRYEGLDKRQVAEQITLDTQASLCQLKKWFDDGSQGEPP